MANLTYSQILRDRNQKAGTYQGANIRFYLNAEQNKQRTEKEGRPIFDEHEMIEVHFPGGDKTCMRVEPKHIEAYPEQYKAFKEGQEQPTTGMPLSEWALITRAHVEELRFFGVKTVEQLALLTDDVKRKMTSISPLVKKAKAWLAASEGAQGKVTALEEQNDKLNAKVRKLEEQLMALMQRIEATEGTRLQPINGLATR